MTREGFPSSSPPAAQIYSYWKGNLQRALPEIKLMTDPDKSPLTSSAACCTSCSAAARPKTEGAATFIAWLKPNWAKQNRLQRETFSPVSGFSLPCAEFQLEDLRVQLDEKGLAIAERQEASVMSRKKLAETTKGRCLSIQKCRMKLIGNYVTTLPRSLPLINTGRFLAILAVCVHTMGVVSKACSHP